MQASVITVAVKPDSWDELSRIYHDVLTPLIGGDSGLVAAMLLRMPDGGEAMSVGVYETIDQAIASGEPDGVFIQAEAKMEHTLAGMPVRSICEVLSISHQ